MPDNRILGGLPGRALAGLLDPDLDSVATWGEADLAALWKHQLAAPLPGRRSAAEGGPATFAELLRDKAPPADALSAAFAVCDRRGPGVSDAAPPELARPLRCALAAAARLGATGRLLADRALSAEIECAAALPWLDQPTQALLSACRERLSEASAADPPASGPDAEPDTGEAAFPLLPGYEVLGRLGEGGMGVVWRARQLGTGRVVAVKALRGWAFGSERARRRFEREVELASQLEHPHIARVYESGVARGGRFYAMELVDGPPLDQFVRERRLSRREVLGLVSLLCRAMQYAHERGVIHRDLKPSNVLIGADGRPRVLDFGLAKASADWASGGDDATLSLHLSLEGEIAGTVAFMAPEQARGESADTRSDIYCLGVILLHLLTGRLPHEQSGTRWEALRRVATQEPMRPRQVDASIDVELEAVLLKAMASDPARRYASAGGLADDIDHYLAGEPLSARAPTLAYFAGRWARRRRAPLAVAAAVALALLGTVAWSFVGVERSRRLAVAAEQKEQAQRCAAEAASRAADLARRDAERSAVTARAERARADERSHFAELRLADSLLAQADAMAVAHRWVKAKQQYHEAARVLSGVGEGVEAADLGLAEAYRVAPPPLMRYPGRHGAILATAISPDGRVAASGTADGFITLWDALTGRPLGDLRASSKHINALAFSPDGARLMSCGQDNRISVWDVAGRREALRLRPVCGEPLVVAYSPDGKWCIACGTDGARAIYDAATGRPSGLIGRSTGVYTACAVGPSPPGGGSAVAVFSMGGSMESYEAATSRFIGRVTFNDGVSRAAFSSDGRYLLTGLRWDAGLWDGRSLQWIHAFGGHTSDVNAVAFSSDAHVCYTASLDGTIKAWHTNSTACDYTVWGDGSPLEHVSFEADGALAVDGGEDGILRLWSTGADGSVPMHYDVGGIQHACLSPDGRVVFLGCDRRLELRDLATGRLLIRIPLAARRPPYPDTAGVALSPDGHTALFIAGVGDIHLVDFRDGRDRTFSGTEVPAPFDDGGGATACTFSPDGTQFLESGGTTIGLFDTATGRRNYTIRTAFTQAHGICFSRDGRAILGATSHGVAQAWDRATGHPIPTFGWFRDRREMYGCNVAFTADRQRALGAVDTRLIYWRTATGALLETLAGHRGIIRGVALSPGERWAFSAGEDGVVKSWDLKRACEARTYVPEDPSTRHIFISADGKRLVAAGASHLTVWDLDASAAYSDFDARLQRARQASAVAWESGHEDPGALKALGEWYAFRGQWTWAAELLRRARDAGSDVPPLTFARCCWLTGDLAEARRQFLLAKSRGEAPAAYLDLCVRAIDHPPGQ